jgi:hypothetical protein
MKTPLPTLLKKGRRRWRRLVALAAVLFLAGSLGLLICMRPFSTPATQSARKPAQLQPADADARFRRLIVGIWSDEYQGKRTMTLNEDGTGTMVVELSGWRAAMSASRLRFEMQWRVEAGRLKKRTIGGEPAAQVQMILNIMGDRVDEPILELTASRLLLLDHDGKTKYDWQRVKN